MSELCPKVPKCPLFNDTLLKRKGSAESYKNLFCKAGEEKYLTCKRFLTSKKFGKAPLWVMPNSHYTLEQIEEKMRKKGEL